MASERLERLHREADRLGFDVSTSVFEQCLETAEDLRATTRALDGQPTLK